MISELKDMEEIRCPDCKKPLAAYPASPESPNPVTFYGCNCENKEWLLTPSMVILGFAGGPLTVYKKTGEPMPASRIKALSR